MDAEEDDDLKLQQTAPKLLSDLARLLPRIIRHQDRDSTPGVFRRHVKEADIKKLIFAKLEQLQEDPQLLDPYLKTFLPPLVDAYLYSLQRERKSTAHGFLPLSHAICRILDLFCKIRGEKVVKGFLNNEPLYLDLILAEFESSEDRLFKDGSPVLESISPWTERYILLVWLSHLMLAPFPLTSFSGLKPSTGINPDLQLFLPPELPEVTLRVLTACLGSLHAATKERGAATTLLVKLCLRPDMQDLGLLSALTRWVLSFLSNVDKIQSSVHQCLGMLSFLSGLLKSASTQQINLVLTTAGGSAQHVISWSTLNFVQSSAVARKLLVKIFRGIAVHCLQALSSDDASDLLEQIIQFLLESLGDGDTPVRLAASKALSMITMKVDEAMAGDIFDAIKASLDENVFMQGPRRNLNAVNALQWHGLVLTLSHLLYRKAVRATQLGDILEHLLLALAFEQRSAQGGSIGTNVRDAACFGIWSWSRRYTNEELLSLDDMATAESGSTQSVSVPRRLAAELLVAACLDPSGNIRRGASAALQELIGRHPDTITEGIQLVQTVDYHAVGLRQRAMIDVAREASGLDRSYWTVLFQQLLRWRGAGSLDAPSRRSAASSVGQLCIGQPCLTALRMIEEICTALMMLERREIEERHGLSMALSCVIEQARIEGLSQSREVEELRVRLASLWALLERGLFLEEKSFVSTDLRPELTAFAVCKFLEAMADACIHLDDPLLRQIPTQLIVRTLNLCLRRHEESVLTAIPGSVRAVIALLSRIDLAARDQLLLDWLTQLQAEASYTGLRCSGHAVALGAAFTAVYASGTENFASFSDSSDDTEVISPAEYAQTSRRNLPLLMLDILTFRCTTAVAVEARTVALQAIDVLLDHWRLTRAPEVFLPTGASQQIVGALHEALNDYTVTERGDVGALVRLQALRTTEVGLKNGLLRGEIETPTDLTSLDADLLRLSLEKLDKIRTRASGILRDHNALRELLQVDPKRWYPTQDVSSFLYFANILPVFYQPAATDQYRQTICLGVLSSAGMGSESVMRESRNVVAYVLHHGLEDPARVLEFVNNLLAIFQSSLNNDKVLLELLEIFAFLFDCNAMDRLISTNFSFRNLLSCTQKSHFKSSNMQKLLLALDVYRGLVRAPSTKRDTLVKMTSMLLHPFPRVREAAATQLYMVTYDDNLRNQVWTKPTKELKSVVELIKSYTIPPA
ncbi:hypothetical protein K491DRAFT_766476 [Lophiostoma macrostomum CBS 122681]|uniref:Uncharacterized protein n=1 Tax=Lophiostoma macrostomum CBS 122681 TaxID=1314788 RepID=A0A6A6TGC2_9PLEO|nr:hypothetical protein K491DRAFT_766476 [Lophiostoma macrostomum CBS 122681]